MFYVYTTNALDLLFEAIQQLNNFPPPERRVNVEDEADDKYSGLTHREHMSWTLESSIRDNLKLTADSE